MSVTAASKSFREELLELTRCALSHLEHQTDSGSWGLPVQKPQTAVDRILPLRLGTPGETSADKLLLLQEQARQCTRCPLHVTRNQSVFARGSGSSGVVFIGEGPGADEDRQGLPFVGAAGQLLDRMIVAMGLSLDSVYICNIVKCRPPKNRKPEASEVSECSPLLKGQLQLIQPRVIIALGATAMQGLLGTTSGITRLRGQWHHYENRIPVMPTFHPAYLLRQPKAKREVWLDLKQVVALLEEK